VAESLHTAPIAIVMKTTRSSAERIIDAFEPPYFLPTSAD